MPPLHPFRRQLPVLLTIATLALAPYPAAAASLDYTALEQLFGEPVTTSATGTPQRATDVAADMTIITADDIRRSGATDIPGILKHVLGIDVLQWTRFSADVSVRGYDSPFSPRLLVLLDGRQVYLDDYGRTTWNAIPVELPEIRQIEVVKGPNSALFGFNAAGGVVNIITYNPLYDDVNRAVMRAGTDEYGQLSMVGTGRISDRAALRISLGGFYGDDSWPANQLATHGPLRTTGQRGSLALDGHVLVGDSGDIELEATHVHVDQREVNPLYLFVNGSTDVNSLRAKYSVNTGIGSIEASAYTNFADIRADTPGMQEATAQDALTVVQLQDTFKLGALHTFRISTEYRHSGTNVLGSDTSRLHYDIGSLGGAWTWQVLPDLELTAAARLDSLWLGRSGPPVAGSGLTDAAWRRNITEPSYNLGLVYKIDDRDTLRATAARGAQLPSLLFLGALVAHSGRFIETGVPTLDPTIVTNYELGWDHALPPIAASTRLSVFYQETTDLMAFGAVPRLQVLRNGAILSTPQNIGSSDEVGLEVSAKGSLAGGWRWSFGYSPRLVRDHFDAGLTPANTGTDYQHTTPTHVVDASLGWSGNRWEVDVFAHYQSSTFGLLQQDATHFVLSPVSNYISFDGRAAYRINKHATLSLSGQDFLVHAQQQSAISTAERRIIGALSLEF